MAGNLPPNIRIRGVAGRASIPAGYLLGRIDGGDGAVQLLNLSQIRTFIGGTVAGTTYTFNDTAEIDFTNTANVITASLINNSIVAAREHFTATQRILGRNTAAAGAGEEVTATQVLDWLGAVQGDIVYRNGTVWTVLAPGTTGQVLTTQGAAANPTWASVSGATITLDSLQDVNTAGVADGYIIYFDAASSTWLAAAPGTAVSVGTQWNPEDAWLSRVTIHPNGLGMSNKVVAGVFGSARSTTSKSSGKFYFEARLGRQAGAGGQAPLIGVATSGHILSSFVGNQSTGYGISALGNRFTNNVSTAGTAYSDGDVIGISVDFTAGTGSVNFFKNNAANGSYTGLTLGTMFIMGSTGNTSNDTVLTLRTTAAQCSFSPPAGYSNWG